MRNATKKHEAEIDSIGRSRDNSSFALRENFSRLQRAMKDLERNILKASKLIVLINSDPEN